MEQLLLGLEVHHQVILARTQLPGRDPIGSSINLWLGHWKGFQKLSLSCRLQRWGQWISIQCVTHQIHWANSRGDFLFDFTTRPSVGGPTARWRQKHTQPGQVSNLTDWKMANRIDWRCEDVSISLCISWGYRRSPAMWVYRYVFLPPWPLEAWLQCVEFLDRKMGPRIRPPEMNFLGPFEQWKKPWLVGLYRGWHPYPGI